MLTCRDISELVTDYVEERMPLPKRLLFQVHLAMCDHCRAYLRQLEITRASLGQLPKIEVPKQMEDELRRRLAGWKKS